MKIVPQHLILSGLVGLANHWLLPTSLSPQVSSSVTMVTMYTYSYTIVNATMEEMLSGLCHYGDDVFHYDDKVFGFENASSDGLEGWGASKPTITTLDPYCGRRSLYVSS